MTDYLHYIRSYVGQQRIPLVFGGAIVRDAGGRVLWQRRGDNGAWGLLGGILELNETLEECVIREAREESGLIVQPTRLLGIYSSPDFNVTYPNGDLVQQVTVAYECRVTGGSLHVDQGETLALEWRDPQDIPPGSTAWYQAMLADLSLTEPGFAHGAAGAPTLPQGTIRWLRQHIGHGVIISPGAATLVLDDQQRVLLQHRTDFDVWGIPGGTMELGERIDITAERETWEETGLHVKAETLVGVFSHPNLKILYPNGDELQPVSAIFRCRVTGGTLRADGTESSQVGFFALDDLPPLTPYSRLVLSTILHN